MQKENTVVNTQPVCYGICWNTLAEPIPCGPYSFSFFPAKKLGVRWILSPFSPHAPTCSVCGWSSPTGLVADTRTSAWNVGKDDHAISAHRLPSLTAGGLGCNPISFYTTSPPTKKRKQELNCWRKSAKENLFSHFWWFRVLASHNQVLSSSFQELKWQHLWNKIFSL